VSILLHGVAVSLMSYALMHAPQISDPTLNKRYAVRHLELHVKEPATPQAGGKADGGAGEAESQPAGGAAAAWETPQFAAALQTLVQPDLPQDLALKEKIPIPAVVIWTPKKVATKKIVPPLPQQPAVAKVRAALDEPNAELQLANQSMASTDSAESLALLTPGTTSPVTIDGPEPLQMAPAMASESTELPTPVATLSLSDLRMKQGTVTLPPANQTLPNPLNASKAPSLAAKGSRTGADGPGSGSADGAGAKAKGERAEAAAGDGGTASKTDAANEKDSGNNAGADHLTFPKNGQYGVVVVGSSLEDEYPELLRIWGGRIAYTVYLQVGRSKNWILQYSLPRDQDDGSGATLDAPWPYDVTRPHLIPALLNADAMVLHGMVTREGRFERLSIVYPARAPQGTLVLESLAQWKFRPASWKGKDTAVEVVLVIPNEAD
jgi:hypothetical protein